MEKYTKSIMDEWAKNDLSRKYVNRALNKALRMDISGLQCGWDLIEVEWVLDGTTKDGRGIARFVDDDMWNKYSIYFRIDKADKGKSLDGGFTIRRKVK